MKKIIVVLALLSISQLALAGREDRRQSSQRSRIREGVASGELTKGEAHQLRSQQRRVRRAERRAESDGQVTEKEQAHLENMQDRASKNIYRKKHNQKERKSTSTESSETASE